MEILVGTVGTPESDAAVQVAAEEVRLRGGRLHLTTHVPPPHTERDAQDHGQELESERRRLESEADGLRASGLECEAHFLQGTGRTSRLLVKLAEDVGVDRIVIGTRHRSPVGKLLLGSTASDVILHANCPVLCVKAQD